MRVLCIVGHTKFAIDFADDVAFQAPNDLVLAFTLSGALRYVFFCCSMISHPGYGNDLDGGIGLPVTTAVQTHSFRFAA
jgi:hypothetical protein